MAWMLTVCLLCTTDPLRWLGVNENCHILIMQHAKSSAAAAGAVCRQCRLSRTTSASQPTRAFTTAKFRKERGHWESIENQRSLLVGVADKLALPNATTDISAWKAVTNQQFRAMGGGAALNKHGGSLYRLLTSAFPEMAEASSASRTKLPNGYWKLIDNRRQFFNELAASHSIEKDEVRNGPLVAKCSLECH